jgi:uncharacterized low-complexity protein
MKNKKSILAGSVIAGALVSLSALNADASSLTNFNVLGSGAEVRSGLLSNSVSNLFELTCGAKGDTSKAHGKAAHGKTADAKCGEGKCGGKKDSLHHKDGKTKDGKCGEGKCGEKKSEMKKTK